MAKLLIIKTGSTFPATAAQHGDFEQLFARGFGLPQAAFEVHAAYTNTPLPAPDQYGGIALTGAHSMVTDSDLWIERLRTWLRHAAALEVPMLGVCYGHQLLNQAFGGRSGPHLNGPEVGTTVLRCTPAAAADPLFAQLPKHFSAHVTHCQSALELPADAVVLAANNHDPHQAVRFGNRIWGVQFHPEFSAAVSRDYIGQQRDLLSRHGQNPGHLLAQVCDTPESNGLLRGFANLCAVT